MLDLFNLSVLGAIHTVIGLIALGAGYLELARRQRISWQTTAGKVYVVTTVLTCLTGFGIYRHGGFGPAHALGVITLLTLGAVALAARGQAFGRSAPYVEIAGYTATLFFHMVPTVAETTTRLPLGAPLASSQEAPIVKALTLVFFVMFAAIGAAQVRAERARRRVVEAGPIAGGAPALARS